MGGHGHQFLSRKSYSYAVHGVNIYGDKNMVIYLVILWSLVFSVFAIKINMLSSMGRHGHHFSGRGLCTYA